LWTAGAANQGVNKIAVKGESSSSVEEGWPRHQEKVRSYLVGADGVVLLIRRVGPIFRRLFSGAAGPLFSSIPSLESGGKILWKS